MALALTALALAFAAHAKGAALGGGVHMGWWARTATLAARDASGSSVPPKAVFPSEAPLFGKLDIKVRHLTTADGLPQNQIFDITATPDGMLWLATGMGLVRYDGARFRLYDRGNSGIKADFCTALAVDTKGRLWVGTFSGYAILDQNGFHHRPTLPGDEAEKKIVRMIPSQEGGVWIKTLLSVWRVTEERRDRVASFEGDLREKGVLTLREDGEGDLIIRCDQGRLKVDPSRQRMAPQKFQWESGDINPPHYLGREQYGWASERFVDSPLMEKALALSRFVVRRPGARRTPWVTSFEKTPNLWLARAQDKNRGRQTADFYLCQDIPEGGWRLLRRFRGIDLEAIYEDRRGHIWLGTYASGLYQIIPQAMSTITKANGLKGDMVRSLYPASGGGVWVALHKDKLYRARKRELSQYGTPYGGKADDYRVVYEDSRGRIWFGTAEEGIYRLGESKTAHFTKADGLSANHINDFYEDESGMLWISTVTGLTRFYQGKWATFTQDDGLYDDRIHTLVPDGLGNFWMSGNRGISRVGRAELNAAASGAKPSVESVIYTEIDGMASAEANGDYQHVGCRGENGFIYFPTTRGVVAFEPARLIARDSRPQVILESISIDRKTIAKYVGRDASDESGRSRLQLGPGAALKQSSEPSELGRSADSSSGDPGAADVIVSAGGGDLIQVRFTIASPVSPRGWRFRYRLKGYNSDWVETKLQRQAYYANLPPGRYTFEVQGRNAHGLWSTNTASFSLAIKPHFYQTAAFYYVTGGLGILILWGSHRFRLKRRQQWMELENALKLEREKRRIAQDIHDEVGGHVTRLRFASELAKQHTGDPKKLREQLDQISGIAGEVSNSFSEVIWLTNPRHDNLKNLVSYIRRYISEFSEATGLTPDLRFPDSVPDFPISPDFRRNIYLTVKECLNNVVKHARAARVEVTVQIDEKRLKMLLVDDGAGTVVSESLHGHGLKGMRARIETLEGSFSANSEPGGGTRVEITVPLGK